MILLRKLKFGLILDTNLVSYIYFYIIVNALQSSLGYLKIIDLENHIDGDSWLQVTKSQVEWIKQNKEYSSSSNIR